MESKRHQYGFEYGPVDISCACSDDKKGWVVLLVKTKKYPHGLQLYVTKSGKVRLHSAAGEFVLKPNVQGEPHSAARKEGR